jgi:hypothetical protein
MTAYRIRTLQDRHGGSLYLGDWSTPRRRQRPERDHIGILAAISGALGLLVVLLNASGHLPHPWS